MPIGKQKGNAFERKVAKDLSLWIFNDQHVLKRSSDSGAQKTVWAGDVVPVKQLSDEWNKHWPFVIELKTGYDNLKPSFWNYTIVTKWINKLIPESKIHNQNILWLITQFKNMSPLMFTNIILNIPFHLCFPIQHNSHYDYYYVYNYTKLLEMNFYELYKLEDIIKY